MIKLKNKLSNAFYIVLVAVFASCEPNKQTLEKFCGGVVHDKDQLLNGCKQLTIIKNGKETKVCTYRLEWQTYKLGDTLNCN
jgi:hypothetical protein